MAEINQTKRVSGLLIFGIIIMPAIFAWFTLKDGYSTKARTLSFVYLFVGMLAVFSNKHLDKPVSSQKDSSQEINTISNKSSQNQTIQEVQISELISSYVNNEINADNMYKGKSIQTMGIVKSIKKDIADDLYVTIGATFDEFEIPELQAYFNKTYNDRLAKLVAMSQVTVICKIDGLMIHVQGRDCRIVE